jgi:hypothetical protein
MHGKNVKELNTIYLFKIHCQPIMAENQNTLYLCPRLKPPEKSLSEVSLIKLL